MPAAQFLRSFIQSLAAKCGYLIERRYDYEKYRLDALELLVERCDPLDPNFFFIQIGANDGQSYDPINRLIRRYGWRGIMLEPQPNVFRQLAKNYAGYDRLILENAALASQDGEMPFWTVPEQTGLGSFNKRILYRSGFSDAQITKQMVTTVCPSSLFAKHSVSRIDLLQVDTEGFDFEVIKMIMATGLQPKIISYEHVHLSTVDRHACVELLGQAGYRMLRAGAYGLDTLALLTASSQSKRSEFDGLFLSQ